MLDYVRPSLYHHMKKSWSEGFEHRISDPPVTSTIEVANRFTSIIQKKIIYILVHRLNQVKNLVTRFEIATLSKEKLKVLGNENAETR